ncbi:MAG: hypothetical protein ACRD1H_00580, partial [Vicinamibacterales bacterium]
MGSHPVCLAWVPELYATGARHAPGNSRQAAEETDMARYLDGRTTNGHDTAMSQDKLHQVLAADWVAHPPARIAARPTAARLVFLAPETAAPFVFRLATAPVMAIIWLAAALVEIAQDLTAGLVDSWCALVSGTPALAKLLQLVAGSAAVAGGLWQAGFPIEAWIAGAALVPLLWGWQRLTLRMPLLLMPLSALAAAEALYISMSETRGYWQPAWSSLTDGLPLAGHLPLLVVLPAALLGWQ